jgi:hypothetical protein
MMLLDDKRLALRWQYLAMARPASSRTSIEVQFFSHVDLISQVKIDDFHQKVILNDYA